MPLFRVPWPPSRRHPHATIRMYLGRLTGIDHYDNLRKHSSASAIRRQKTFGLSAASSSIVSQYLESVFHVGSRSVAMVRSATRFGGIPGRFDSESEEDGYRSGHRGKSS